MAKTRKSAAKTSAASKAADTGKAVKSTGRGVRSAQAAKPVASTKAAAKKSVASKPAAKKAAPKTVAVAGKATPRKVAATKKVAGNGAATRRVAGKPMTGKVASVDKGAGPSAARASILRGAAATTAKRSGVAAPNGAAATRRPALKQKLVQHITPEEAVAHIQALIDANHARAAPRKPSSKAQDRGGAVPAVTPKTSTTPRARGTSRGKPGGRKPG